MTAVTARRLAVLVLLSAFLALSPLAQASPPDQTWIGGFYDDADYDDVVLLVTGSLHSVQCAPAPVVLRQNLIPLGRRPPELSRQTKEETSPRATDWRQGSQPPGTIRTHQGTR